MKIGIVGSGNVGRSLGVLWAEHGHDVFFGSRNLERARVAAEHTRSAQYGSPSEAAEYGEAVLWTVRSIPPGEVLERPDLLAGKIVIDPNNAPLREDMRLGPHEDVPSLAERLALDLPDAQVVKAFNTLPIELYELSPTPLRDYGVSVFLASDYPDAKSTVAKLAQKIGLLPVDCGPLKSARMLEGLSDFLRYVSATMGHGPYTSLSVHVLPSAKSQRLGGREPSELT